MSELKPCPFCGHQPELIDKSRESYYINAVKNDKGRTFLGKEMREYGSRGRKRIYYLYKVNEWKIHCSTMRCFARNLNTYFHSKEEAIEAWNRRAEDGN